MGHMTFVALLRRDVLSVPLALTSSCGRITTTLRDCGQVPEPNCKLLSVFCRQSLAVGHVVGVHPLRRQSERVWFRCLFERVQKMSVKSSDGEANEHDSANAILTLLVHARRSLINIGSDSRLVK